ncbi:MAG: dTMP kinase [Planctomycetota bacterium]
MTDTAQFIAFEGVDGAGKSTQAERLAETLRARGVSVVTVREPGGTALGEAVRQILLDASEIPLEAESEALLFLASRVQLYRTVIEPALAAGKTVISDRFHLSTLVYQGIAGELGEPRTRALLGAVLGDRRPDLNVIVRAPLADCLDRLRASEPDRFESRAGFLEKVHAAFEGLSEGTTLGLPGDRIEVVDGRGSPDTVAEQVESRVGSSRRDGKAQA